MKKSLIVFSIVGAFWRRWFGGGFGKLGDITRFFKYLVLVGIVLAMYYTKDILDWTNWRVYAVLITFAIHWAIGHGDYFYVYDTNPDEPRIKWIDWSLRKIYGEGNYYNFKGNVTGLFLRYTSTACLVAVFIPNCLFCIVGVLTSFVYACCGKTKKSIAVSEFLSGFVNFSLLYRCL